MIRIGYASGFWGDDPHAPARTLERASDIDYLAMDYLAEITMAVLKQQQERDDSLGYAKDFPSTVRDLFEALLENDVSLLANAGGVNPRSCMGAVLEAATEADVDVTVAAVTGDDLLDRVPELRERGVSFDNMDTGDPFDPVSDRLVAANAYLGAFPIAKALDAGADVVVTGRCVDAALALGPMIHEFGWGRDEYDRLASGVIAGHILECGTQATGGVLSDGWQDVDFSDMGYPIVEIDTDGEFVVTKPGNTGGQVTEQTVKEQLVYEIKDPANYAVPDVVADFTTPNVETVGPDRVAVTGCGGAPPPESLKVTALYEDGYKAQLLLIYSRPNALAKARTANSVIRERLRAAGLEYDDTHTSFLGYNGCHNGIVDQPEDPPEVVLRLAVKADERSTVEQFGVEALPVLMTGPPNVTPVVEGRPKPQKVLSYWPCTVPRSAVEPTVTVESTGGENR